MFPVSDHSSDVIRGLERELNRLGVHIVLNTEVKELLAVNGSVRGLLLASGKRTDADAVIVAAGGLSYPSTGSTGDGYRMAESCGHKITPLSPALVPMEVKEWYAKELMGLSLRNIGITITDGSKKLYQDFGEMLFTHYGVSGPVILSASSITGSRLKEKELTLHIDLKPALTKEQLDKRVLREFESNHNRQFKNAVAGLFPAKLLPVMVDLSGIPEESRSNLFLRYKNHIQDIRIVKHSVCEILDILRFHIPDYILELCRIIVVDFIDIVCSYDRHPI